jgi:hypothetical protein
MAGVSNTFYGTPNEESVVVCVGGWGSSIIKNVVTNKK